MNKTLGASVLEEGSALPKWVLSWFLSLGTSAPEVLYVTSVHQIRKAGLWEVFVTLSPKQSEHIIGTPSLPKAIWGPGRIYIHFVAFSWFSITILIKVCPGDLLPFYCFQSQQLC